MYTCKKLAFKNSDTKNVGKLCLIVKNQQTNGSTKN